MSAMSASGSLGTPSPASPANHSRVPHTTTRPGAWTLINPRDKGARASVPCVPFLTYSYLTSARVTARLQARPALHFTCTPVLCVTQGRVCASGGWTPRPLPRRGGQALCYADAGQDMTSRACLTGFGDAVEWEHEGD